jgi:tRNA (guanine37-N1)-methyltransferase
LRFDVLTLFPELFIPFLNIGIARRAFDSGQVDVNLINPRDYADGNYRRIDDRPFGGGPGMVMMAEPLEKCLSAIYSKRLDKPPVILFSPAGRSLTHATVEHWATSQGAVLICGRYEGIDQRFIDAHVTEEISLGDFVLSGGEIAAMALLDAVARLQPGVLTDSESHAQDSFNPALDGLLDCPHYTRPVNWRGTEVPEVLISGNHLKIERWRRDQRLVLTSRLRPELIAQARLNGCLSPIDEALLSVL